MGGQFLQSGGHRKGGGFAEPQAAGLSHQHFYRSPLFPGNLFSADGPLRLAEIDSRKSTDCFPGRITGKPELMPLIPTLSGYVQKSGSRKFEPQGIRNLETLSQACSLRCWRSTQIRTGVTGGIIGKPYLGGYIPLARQPTAKNPSRASSRKLFVATHRGTAGVGGCSRSRRE